MAKKKKSQAQIRRLQARAAARGEVYVPPEGEHIQEETEKQENFETDITANETGDAPQSDDDRVDRTKLAAASKLKRELEAIEKDETLKAKDRRSAKRKAEAIAAETSGCPASELLEWYKEYSQNLGPVRKQATDKNDKKVHNPYVVFVGQLAFDTTKEGLFDHVKKELCQEHEITHETVKIRLLTDPKTKKSRGMAFMEVSNPDLLYACLKLHQTFLQGRRINVERSAGGKRNSEARKFKLQQFRQEQEQHISTVVDKMFDDYQTSGEIQANELDDGVVALCKRHSATVVQAALEKYVESNGRDMDNPSAYLSFLLTKLAEEGIHQKTDTSSDQSRPSKRSRPTNENFGMKSANQSSILAKQGVDMGMSDGTKGDLASVFPSLSRGRGRGRGRYHYSL